MKRILVTQRLCKHEQYNEVYDRLDTMWAKLFNEANLLLIPLPSGCNLKLFLEENPIDGILLTGGNNLSCVQDDELSVQRDAIEKEVLHYAVNTNIPVIGVCRGMQVIAHHFGASLIPVKNHSAIKHDCIPSEASTFSSYFNKCLNVNSYHDYAVTDIKEPLHIVAKSSDGSIEAIEHDSKKIVGFMWHPEREKPFINNDIEFLSEFYSIK